MPLTLLNIIFWGVAACLFAFLLFFGINFGIYEPSRISAGLSPRTYPRAVTLLLFCAALYLVVIGVIEHKQAQAHSKKPDKTNVGELFPTVKLVLICVIILAYGFSISYLGLVLASTLAFTLLTRLNGEQRTVHMLCVGAALAVGLYYFFLKVALVPMPPGPFGGVI